VNTSYTPEEGAAHSPSWPNGLVITSIIIIIIIIYTSGYIVQLTPRRWRLYVTNPRTISWKPSGEKCVKLHQKDVKLHQKGVKLHKKCVKLHQKGVINVVN
jgi:hypothetical protein